MESEGPGWATMRVISGVYAPSVLLSLAPFLESIIEYLIGFIAGVILALGGLYAAVVIAIWRV